MMPESLVRDLDDALAKVLEMVRTQRRYAESTSLSRRVDGIEVMLVIGVEKGDRRIGPREKVDRFSTIEEAVLEVLADGAVLLGTELANRTGYAYGTLKVVLAGLVRRQVLENRNPGYAIRLAYPDKMPLQSPPIE